MALMPSERTRHPRTIFETASCTCSTARSRRHSSPGRTPPVRASRPCAARIDVDDLRASVSAFHRRPDGRGPDHYQRVYHLDAASTALAEALGLRRQHRADWEVSGIHSDKGYVVRRRSCPRLRLANTPRRHSRFWSRSKMDNTQTASVQVSIDKAHAPCWRPTKAFRFRGRLGQVCTRSL